MSRRTWRWCLTASVILWTLIFLAVKAAADVPAGFVSHPELASRAAVIAGKPVNVYCATSDTEWRAYEATLSTPGDYRGNTPVIGGTETALRPAVCGPLLKKIRGQSVPIGSFSISLFTLAHESEHMKGIADEHQADCAALADIPKIAPLFGIHKKATLATVMWFANLQHRTGLPAYSYPCNY